MSTLDAADEATAVLDLATGESGYYTFTGTLTGSVIVLQSQLGRSAWSELRRFTAEANGYVNGPGKFRLMMKSLTEGDTVEATVTASTDTVESVVGPNGAVVRTLDDAGNESVTGSITAGTSLNAGTDVNLSSTGVIYLGVSTTAGSWRIKRNASDLVIQRFEGAEGEETWVTKSTIAAV